MHFEVAEVFEKPVSNLSVPRIIPHRSHTSVSQDSSHAQRYKLPVRNHIGVRIVRFFFFEK